MAGILAGTILAGVTAQSQDEAGFDTLQQEAREAIADGAFELALSRYEAMQAAAPENAEVAYNRGSVLLDLDRPAEARDAFLEAIELGLDSEAVYFNLGNAYMALEEFGDAAAAYRTVVERTPDDGDAAVNLALALRADGRIDEAIEALEAAGSAGAIDAYLALGAIQLENGSVAEASDAYRSALDIDNGSYEARLNYGTTLYRLGDFAGALAEFDTLREQAPDDLDVLFNQGMAAIAAALGRPVRVVAEER